jgi:hypothetical protein
VFFNVPNLPLLPSSLLSTNISHTDLVHK